MSEYAQRLIEAASIPLDIANEIDETGGRKVRRLRYDPELKRRVNTQVTIGGLPDPKRSSRAKRAHIEHMSSYSHGIKQSLKTKEKLGEINPHNPNHKVVAKKARNAAQRTVRGLNLDR